MKGVDLFRCLKYAQLGILLAILGCGATPPQTATEVLEVDLLVEGGTVLTMDAVWTVHSPGFVAIRGDEIVEVGNLDQAAGMTARRRIDARGGIVTPGLINGHQHAPMSVMRGVADDLELMEWLQRYIFPAEAQFVDPDLVYWGTRLSVAEMLRTGTTTYADMYYFEDQVALATSQAGMRGILAETIIDFPTPDFPDSATAILKTRDYLAKWKDHPLITPAIAPHAPFTCSAETLMATKAVADEMDVPLLIHLAETEDEVRQVREKTGTTPVRYLERLGFLSDRVLAAHVVWVDAEEIQILKNRGVGVVHNPESNMKLASGVAPIPEMLEAGIDLGVGTDGPASNNNLDLLQEIDTMAKLHKLFRRDTTLIDARTAFTIATRGGAAALGMSDRVGSLEKGKRADLIVIGTDTPAAVPLFDPYSALVYSLAGSSVRVTVVNGQVVFQDGKLTGVDESEVFAKVREIADRLREAVGRGQDSQ